MCTSKPPPYGRYLAAEAFIPTYNTTFHQQALFPASSFRWYWYSLWWAKYCTMPFAGTSMYYRHRKVKDVFSDLLGVLLHTLKKCWYTRAANYLISKPLDSQKYLHNNIHSKLYRYWWPVPTVCSIFSMHFMYPNSWTSPVRCCSVVRESAVSFYIDDDGSPLHKWKS